MAIPEVVDRPMVLIGRGKGRGRARGKGRGRGEAVEAHTDAEVERDKRLKGKEQNLVMVHSRMIDSSYYCTWIFVLVICIIC